MSRVFNMGVGMVLIADPSRADGVLAQVAGSWRLGSVVRSDASGGERPGVPHHTVGIEGPDDPEELKREIEAKGIAVDHIRMHGEREPGGYSLYVEDPSGNRIELSKSGN